MEFTDVSLLHLKGTNQYQLPFWSPLCNSHFCSNAPTWKLPVIWIMAVQSVKKEILLGNQNHFWVKSQVLYSIGKVIRSSHTTCNISVRDLSPRSQIHSTLTWNSKQFCSLWYKLNLFVYKVWKILNFKGKHGFCKALCHSNFYFSMNSCDWIKYLLSKHVLFQFPYFLSNRDCFIHFQKVVPSLQSECVF